MQGMSDKEFDEFFKKTAENYDIPYNPKAWSRMRTKLDKADGMGGNNIRKIITGLALLILLGIGSFWYLGNTQDISSSKKVHNVIAPPQEVNREPSIQSPSASATDAEATLKASPAVPDRKRAENQKDAGSTDKPKQKVAMFSSGEENNSYTSIEQKPQLFSGEEVSYYDRNLTFLSPLSWSPLPVSRTLDHRVVQLVSHEAAIPPVQGPEENKEERNITPGRSSFYRLGLSFTVSPDLSAIGWKHISQVGTKSGFGFEYFIFRNLSLSTGIIFSHKIYSATEGYELSSGYDYYPKPTSIEAECNVLDIPLNLRYYVVNSGKSRIYLSSGLSSYLMLKEDYEYKYEQYNADRYRSHSVRNENQHYFKVSNFSLGYERVLGKRWALQAEPFVKIPLAGVGEGKVKLSTAGMFVTLNYRFGLAKLNKK